MESSAQTELEDLLARTALGDRVAFESLYRLTSAKLFSVVLRILIQESLAEETLQDVYLQIWHKARDYRADHGRPMTWLISLARYRAIDALRAQGRHAHGDTDQRVLDQLIEAARGPAEQAEGEQCLGQVGDCLERLEPPRHECIVLAYVEGYTQEELSERYQAPLGTVKSWMRRGLKALKDCLEGMG